MRTSSLIAVISLSGFLYSCAGSPQLVSQKRPGVFISKSDPIAVVPAKIRGSNDIDLPDAIATELLGSGLNVVERTTFAQMVKEKGLDLTEILNGEEYLKVGELTDITKIVIVNAKMMGPGVAYATVRVVDTKSGSILLSTTYTQPQPESTTYLKHDDIIETARTIAKTIISVVR